MILNIFLVFGDFEPSDSYKNNSYKKTVYVGGLVVVVVVGYGGWVGGHNILKSLVNFSLCILSTHCSVIGNLSTSV